MSKGKRESLKYKLAFLQSNCVDLIVSNANYPIDLSIFLHSSYEYCQALITHCFIHTKPKSRLGLLLCLGSRTVRLRWFLSFFPPSLSAFLSQGCLPALQESWVFPVERDFVMFNSAWAGWCSTWGLQLPFILMELIWLRCLPPFPWGGYFVINLEWVMTVGLW